MRAAATRVLVHECSGHDSLSMGGAYTRPLVPLVDVLPRWAVVRRRTTTGER
jgi:hypothetical protein